MGRELISKSQKSSVSLIGGSTMFWGSPVAHLVKNMPAMQESWVQSLGWEDPLEKEKATHSGILT